MARYITVASVSHHPGSGYWGNYDGLLDHAAHMIWRAKKHGAGIVSFPEIYCQWIAPNAVAAAEPLDGPSTVRMQKEAKKNNIHVVWPLYTLQDGKIFNSSLLIAPDGEIIGDYHKMFPTLGEMDEGCVPGYEANVYETDFGKVGMCICFDLNYFEIMQGLKDNGAEVIFFGSAYKGGRQVQYWAYQLGCYMVSAVASERGQIVGQGGNLLAESTYEELIACPINLDSRLLHMDYNWEKMDAMLKRYGTGVRIEYFTPEAHYRIASEKKGLSVEDLIEEFDLLKREDYWVKARKRRIKELKKNGT